MSEKKKIRVYVAVPTTGTVVDGQEYVRRRLEKKYADEIEMVYPERCTQRIFHDFARNCHVRDFLASGCDIMWFLDSDIIPPDDVFDLITKHGDKWQAAGCPYPVFMTTSDKDVTKKVVLAIYKKSPDTGWLHAGRVPTAGGTEFVDGVATGCIFLKREVFDGMEEPYFEFKYRKDDRYIIEGEDMGFCMKLSKKGIQFFVDFNMVCQHWKRVDLMDVNDYALEYAQNAINAYDASIRPQIENALSASKQLGYAKGFEAGQKAGKPASTLWTPTG